MTTNQSKPRRRWFQFSLRTLFVLVTLFCIWLALTVNAARKQREAVAAIEALGGRVFYEYEWSFPSPEPSGPKWLRELVGEEYFFTIIDVDLRSTKVTDAGLEHLKGLKSLVQLDLNSTKVTDEGVEKLQKALPNCEIYGHVSDYR